MLQPGLKQLLISKQKSAGDDIKSLNEDYSYKILFLSSIIPDQSNARFLPTILINDEHADLLIKRGISKQKLVDMYNAEDAVMVGKGVFVNCLKYGSVDWKKANESIESIIELAHNISRSEIIQAPTVYPLNDGTYKVLTGHRRFLAMIYNFGVNGNGQFKVYESQPVLTKLKQFQENACREDLPQYGKLEAFMNARMELDTLSDVRKQLGQKKLTVREEASLLGISMGAYDNYNVLTRYPAVIKFYEQGKSRPFTKTKKDILEIENSYKVEQDKTKLNVEDKRQINKKIESLLGGAKAEKAPVKPKISLKGINSKPIMVKILTSNLMELDTGIDWETLDWEDNRQIEKAFESVVEYLMSQENLTTGE